MNIWNSEVPQFTFLHRPTKHGKRSHKPKTSQKLCENRTENIKWNGGQCSSPALYQQPTTGSQPHRLRRRRVEWKCIVYALWATCSRAHVYRCHIVTSVKVKIVPHKFSISLKFIHYKSSFAPFESEHRLLFADFFFLPLFVGKCKLNVCVRCDGTCSTKCDAKRHLHQTSVLRSLSLTATSSAESWLQHTE